MKQFFKMMFASMLGFVIAWLLIITIVFGIIGIAVSSLDDKKETSIKSNSILEMKFDYPIPERTSKNPFENFSIESLTSSKALGLDDIIKNIKKATADDKVKAIYLHAGFSPNSYATLEEIRNALIEFRKTGKFIISYGEYVDEHSYYLCSVADKIYLNPAGDIILNGFSSNVVYMKGLLDKVGVQPQLIRHGKFKTAAESLIADKMSDENREQISVFMGSVYKIFLENIAKARGITTEEFRNISNQMLVRCPEDAIKYKVIDSTRYEDELEKEFKTLLSLKEDDDLNFVASSKYTNVRDKKSSVSDDKIAVIYCVGEIVSGKGGEGKMGSVDIAATIKKVRLDKKYKAIVLRINSPGGSALASDVICREVNLAKKQKPVIVSMGDVAASGGYYIATPADVIVAQPNTITGSIGVFGLLLNAQELLNNKLGIKIETVKFGEFSDLGRADRPLTDAERSIIQKVIDRIYNDFIKIVATGRKLTPAAVDSIAQGRVWCASDAKKIGLVDEFGGLDRAIAIAAKKAKLKDFRTVSLPEQKEPIEELLKSLGSDIETYYAKKQLGESYKYYNDLKSVLQNQGVQARMEFKLEIE